MEGVTQRSSLGSAVGGMPERNFRRGSSKRSVGSSSEGTLPGTSSRRTTRRSSSSTATRWTAAPSVASMSSGMKKKKALSQKSVAAHLHDEGSLSFGLRRHGQKLLVRRRRAGDTFHRFQERLQHHYSHLELVTTSFGEVVDKVKASRSSLGELLDRVRNMYKFLFREFMGDLADVQAVHEAERARMAAELERTRVEYQTKVDDLNCRIRVLSQSCASRDVVIGVLEENAAALEKECEFLRGVTMSEAATTREKARMLVSGAARDLLGARR